MSGYVLKLCLIAIAGLITCPFHKYWVESLKLGRVILPPHKLEGESAVLQCPYELGRDSLYAVKWFKDNEEFFRYVPKYKQPMFEYQVNGIHVQKSASDSNQVVLEKLEMGTTGNFRCEVSAEGPSFASVKAEGNMTVVYLPRKGPEISGELLEEYEAGDIIRFNCTSSESFPPARLFWYINATPIQAAFVKMLSPSNNYSSATILKSTSKSELIMPLEDQHFVDGSARIRCIASIFSLFWQDGAEKIVNNFLGNSRPDFDLRLRSAINSPIIDDREAQVLVRGSGTSISHGNILAILPTGILLVMRDIW